MASDGSEHDDERRERSSHRADNESFWRRNNRPDWARTAISPSRLSRGRPGRRAGPEGRQSHLAAHEEENPGEGALVCSAAAQTPSIMCVQASGGQPNRISSSLIAARMYGGDVIGVPQDVRTELGAFRAPRYALAAIIVLCCRTFAVFLS